MKAQQRVEVVTTDIGLKIFQKESRRPREQRANRHGTHARTNSVACDGLLRKILKNAVVGSG